MTRKVSGGLTGSPSVGALNIAPTAVVTAAADQDITLSPTGTGMLMITANAQLNAQSDLRWADADSSNWVAFQGASTIAANVTWTLPATDGGKAKEKFVILTGETTYRDVPAGKKHFAGVFLPPAAVLRFSSHKPNGEEDWKGGRMNLKVEAMDGGSPIEKSFDLQGEKEAGLSGRGGKKDPEWNKSTEAQEVTGALLPICDTPFWPKDYKRYPQPKKP